MIRIETNDGKEFEITRDMAMCSGLLSEMIDEEDTIPLPLVDSNVMREIIIFMEHHVVYPLGEIEKPIKSANMEDLVGRWYADFINKFEDSMVFKIIEASNYMEIDRLLHLGCVKVATTLKGKTSEEIKEIFDIKD